MIGTTTQYHPLLEGFMRVAPFLNELYSEDMTIGVSDTEKLLLSIPGKTFTLGLESGYILQEGDGMYEAVKYNKAQKTYVPKEVFGYPIIAMAIPLHNEDGEIIGAVGVGVSLEQYNTLLGIASSLSAAVQQVTTTIEEVAGSTTILSENMNQINEQSNFVLESVTEIEKIAKTVSRISMQSNILGLNASIEAARAGEHGKGFAVVASEIQKMARNSKDYADEITNSAGKINELITKLSSSILNISNETVNQSAATQELSATMQELSTNARLLAEVARKAIGETN